MPSVASSAVLPLLLSMLVYTAATSAFGDSISNAGNFVTFFPEAPATAPPAAEALGLAFSPPFLGVDRTTAAAEFRQGANFAVGGATALGKDFFKDMGLNPALVRFIPPYSLDVQMEWFKQVLHLLGPTEQERRSIMSSSLFVLGEIGENEYSYLILQNRSIDTVIKPLVVPKVVAKIENAVKALLELGAKTIVVPGDFPTPPRPTHAPTAWPAPRSQATPVWELRAHRQSTHTAGPPGREKMQRCEATGETERG